jgi:hypothetical protein
MLAHASVWQPMTPSTTTLGSSSARVLAYLKVTDYLIPAQLV